MYIHIFIYLCICILHFYISQYTSPGCLSQGNSDTLHKDWFKTLLRLVRFGGNLSVHHGVSGQAHHRELFSK